MLHFQNVVQVRVQVVRYRLQGTRLGCGPWGAGYVVHDTDQYPIQRVGYLVQDMMCTVQCTACRVEGTGLYIVQCI